MQSPSIIDLYNPVIFEGDVELKNSSKHHFLEIESLSAVRGCRQIFPLFSQSAAEERVQLLQNSYEAAKDDIAALKREISALQKERDEIRAEGNTWRTEVER